MSEDAIWSPLGLGEDPVSGQRCLFWLEKGMKTSGLGDTSAGLHHLLDGTYFADGDALRALYPNVELPAELGDSAFMLREGTRAIPLFLFSHWRLCPPPPCMEIPDGMTRCNGCGNVMRKLPSPEGDADAPDTTYFRCPDCNRRVNVTVEVINAGSIAKGETGDG